MKKLLLLGIFILNINLSYADPDRGTYKTNKGNISYARLIFQLACHMHNVCGITIAKENGPFKSISLRRAYNPIIWGYEAFSFVDRDIYVIDFNYRGIDRTCLLEVIAEYDFASIGDCNFTTRAMLRDDISEFTFRRILKPDIY